MFTSVAVALAVTSLAARPEVKILALERRFAEQTAEFARLNAKREALAKQIARQEEDIMRLTELLRARGLIK